MAVAGRIFNKPLGPSWLNFEPAPSTGSVEVRPHVYAYIYIHVCLCIYVYVYMYVCMHFYIYLETFVNVCVYMYIYICIYVYSTLSNGAMDLVHIWVPYGLESTGKKQSSKTGTFYIGAFLALWCQHGLLCTKPLQARLETVHGLGGSVQGSIAGVKVHGRVGRSVGYVRLQDQTTLQYSQLRSFCVQSYIPSSPPPLTDSIIAWLDLLVGPLGGYKK